MYIPAHFRDTDVAAMHALIRSTGLTTLVTATAEGPVATPLPMYLVAEEGSNGTLYGHIARANPQWRVPALGDSLALFRGPDAYVSPSLYPGKREHGKVVPTWNYVAAHAYGPVEFFEDPDRLLDVVTRLTTLHEGARADPWAVSDAPADYVSMMLKGIIGVRLPITRLDGKRKLSQNRDAADRASVVAGLAASDRPGDRAIAALITP